jgi:CDP-diacylglycerol--glycerol-3-phosphate 3-phosphatidyltransferase
MLTQVVAITLLILGSRTTVSGDAVAIAPPIDSSESFATLSATIGALSALADPARGLTIETARLLTFAAGRLMLWIVVFTATWSMIEYFRRFYGKIRTQVEVRERRLRRLRVTRRRRARAESNRA